MRTIIEVTNCIIELYIALFFFKRVLAPKEVSKSLYYSSTLIVLIIHVGRSFVPIDTYLNFAITGLLWGYLILTLFKDIFFKKLGIFLLYFVVVIISDTLCRFTLSIVINVANHYEQPPTGLERYLGMVICNVLNFTLLSCISTISRKKIKSVDLKYWVMMFLFPLFSLFIIISSDIFIVLSGTTEIKYIVLLLIIVIGLLYFNISVFEFIDSYSAKIQLESAKQLIKHQEENYQLLEINERELRKLKHNIDQHLVVMRTLIQNDALDDSTLLMDSLENLASLPVSIVYTNDSTLDAILNIECKKAAEKGIKFIVKTHNLLAPINIDPLDKSTILCNALNNAIEACADINGRAVIIDINSTIHKVKILIENSSLPRNFASKSIFSTKEDSRNHGFGIESIRLSLQRYNGCLDISYSNGITSCIITFDNQ